MIEILKQMIDNHPIFKKYDEEYNKIIDYYFFKQDGIEKLTKRYLKLFKVKKKPKINNKINYKSFTKEEKKKYHNTMVQKYREITGKLNQLKKIGEGNKRAQLIKELNYNYEK